MDKNHISLCAAAALPILRVDGRKPHKHTLRRWGSHGVLSKSGQRVRLKLTQMPIGVVTTEQDVLAFVAALNDETPATPAGRQREVDAAEKELQQAGLA